MKLYFGHSKDFDFVNEYYKPIEADEDLQKETLIFPHDVNINNANPREFYKTIDVFIAEVSYKATGLGIELGWCYDDNVPVYCFYKENMKPSNSVYQVANEVIAYKDSEDLIRKIKEVVYK